MNVYERLLKYVVIRTSSNEESDTTPSSQCQFDLANVLKKEMEDLGICNVILTDSCFLYGKIPATPGYENAPAIGFIAHMDTVSDYCDHDIKPMITEKYDGEALALGESGVTLSPEMFPHLKNLKGRTLITSDGTTILGADDPKPENATVTVVNGMEVYLLLKDLIDGEKERERIAKEKIQMEKEISRLEGKLSNQGFLAKAPEAVVAKEKEKLEEYKQKQQALLEREAFLETL